MAKHEEKPLQPADDAVQDEEELKRQVLSDHNLPTGGGFPFVPPRHWRSNQPLRKNSNGEYIDSKGRRWRKGPSRTEAEDWEWDVQLPNGDHLNIDWGGNVTHPRPKIQVPKGQTHRGLGGKPKRAKELKGPKE